MELLIIATVIALVIYGLERNRSHNPNPTATLSGSTDITDRDAERISHELLSHP